MIGRPPRSTLFPNTTLSRSVEEGLLHAEGFAIDLHVPEAGARPPIDRFVHVVEVVEVQVDAVLRLGALVVGDLERPDGRRQDRKSTRLNSSHLVISYAVFCL